jgi:predicted ribosome quality control (RQC) complex YloA/Tae2 family protein
LSLNWKEIDLILEELDLPGSFIRQIHQPGYSSLVFDLYRRKQNRSESIKLFISLSNPHCRIHSLSRKIPNPERPLRFASFLRACIRNGRIVSAEQIAGERIIKIKVAREQGSYDLWIRLWASAANLIVTDGEGKILDAFYRRPKRKEISGGYYRPEVREKKQDHGAYEVRDFPGEGSFNERVERTFFEGEEEEEKQALRRKVLRELKARENAIRIRLKKLEGKRGEYAGVERFRELGDLIKSSLHKIKKRDRWLTVTDYLHGNKEVDIELDPQNSPAENAENYYRLYKKTKKAAGRLEDELEELKAGLSSIASDEDRLFHETNLAVLRSMGRSSARTGRKDVSMPGLVFAAHGHRFLVGRTALENDTLLRSHVSGNDYWFHARDYAGAYVFVKAVKKTGGALKGKSIPLEAMLDAGNLALFYSKGRNSGQGNIYYTRVKYLRRTRGGKKGLVIPTQEKNLFIKADPQLLEKLRGSRGLY